MAAMITRQEVLQTDSAPLVVETVLSVVAPLPVDVCGVTELLEVLPVAAVAVLMAVEGLPEELLPEVVVGAWALVLLLLTTQLKTARETAANRISFMFSFFVVGGW